MDKKVVLKFSLKTAEVKVEAFGFQGNSCKAATEFLCDTLGKCTDFQEKAEWYETNLELSGCINSNFCG